MIEIQNLMQCLTELSSREFQARAWLATDGPEVSSFEESVCQTLDDTGLSDAISAGRCPAELSAKSFEALLNLDAAVSRVPQGLPPAALLDNAAMEEVRTKASHALKLLKQHLV